MQKRITERRANKGRTDVCVLKLASQVALDERRLADAAVADKNELELWDVLGSMLRFRMTQVV